MKDSVPNIFSSFSREKLEKHIIELMNEIGDLNTELHLYRFVCASIDPSIGEMAKKEVNAKRLFREKYPREYVQQEEKK